jgi:ferritin-like metal-binding protein YciE
MTLTDILTEDIQRLRSAELDQLRTLPQLAESATNPDLQAAFHEHLAQTQEQVKRLEDILAQMGAKPDSVPCRAADGLRDDALDIIARDTDDEVIDLEIIAAAQKTEHFEIACYSTAKEMTRALGMEEAAALLQQTLSEEEQSNRKFANLMKPLLRTAADIEMEEVEAEDE